MARSLTGPLAAYLDVRASNEESDRKELATLGALLQRKDALEFRDKQLAQAAADNAARRDLTREVTLAGIGSRERIAEEGRLTREAIAAGRPERSERIVAIVGPDGKAQYVRESQALGKTPWSPSMSQSATDDQLSNEAVRDLAIQSLYDPGVLAGYRRDTRAMSRIGNERIKVMSEYGITPQDVVAGRAGFKADAASLNKITPQYDAITAFENTAIRNGKILIDLAKKVDITGRPVVERWIRAGRQSVAGDPDVAQFNAQLQLYRAEAARILTQPNLSGVLTDTARKEMEEFLKGGSSAAQIEGVVNLLERDFKNRKETLEDQIGNIRSRMNRRVAPGGGGLTDNPSPSRPGAGGALGVPAGVDPAVWNVMTPAERALWR